MAKIDKMSPRLRVRTSDAARHEDACEFAREHPRRTARVEEHDHFVRRDLAACDIVIEAVYEELKVKHELLAQLNRVCPAQTNFASNTSTLSITEIAGGSGRDERCVGMHSCLPAQLMKLVEMSPGLNTSVETFQRAWAFCEALGQVLVPRSPREPEARVIGIVADAGTALAGIAEAMRTAALAATPMVLAQARLATAQGDRAHSLAELPDKTVVGKLFDTLAPRFAERPGGYTRILRLGIRRGDAAEVRRACGDS